MSIPNNDLKYNLIGKSGEKHKKKYLSTNFLNRLLFIWVSDLINVKNFSSISILFKNSKGWTKSNFSTKHAL